MDLYRAGVLSLTTLASLGKKKWDYEDSRRAVIGRVAITRTRPAIKEGWEAEFRLLINLPEYIRAADFQEVLVNAGKLVGLGDFRPSYGRFYVVSFKVS